MAQRLPSGLRGRQAECEALDRLVAGVRAGRSGVLVLRGEAGVGKSALLGHLVALADGCRVVRVAGVETEMELAFASLQQLCASLLDEHLDGLPAPQRDALATAFGLRVGDPPDRFLVGLGVLTLLSETANDAPLVCVVDDAQWLDRVSAQTLAFVARRVLAESIALVFVVREPSEETDLQGLPELVVGGLADGDARALLASVLTGPLDAGVRERILDETHGNPLALLELPRGLSAAELAGGFGLPDAAALPGRIEESFGRRLLPLPADTRRLLVLAAAEPAGDPVLVWRAAERLGIGGGAAAPAVAAGLIESGGQVRFHHPLVRSAVYRAASPGERLVAHRELAEATVGVVDADRRAWHRAHATAGLDEEVANELEHSAGRARARGGLAAAAAFFERAAELTPEPELRARRALAAAEGKHQAGAPDAAIRQLALARAGPLGEFDSARADLLGAQIAFVVSHGRDAPPLLLKVAKRLEALDGTLARETYLDAFAAALFAGRLADGGGVREVAEAVRAARWGSSSRRLPEACDLLLEGLAVLLTDGYAAGVPSLKLALRAFRDDPMSDEDGLRWLWLACRVSRALGDDASWDELTERQARLAREAGALALLPVALTERFNLLLLSGRLAAATALAAEADAVIAATGSRLSPRGAITLATWRGSEAEALALVDATRRDVAERGEGMWLAAADWNRAVLCNGLGRYEDALAAAERAAGYPNELGFSTWVWPELIEAAARSGSPERAVEPLHRFTEITRASGAPWLLGIEARSRALLSAGDAAERLYRESIERLSHTRIQVALARTQLNYGEWLRRNNRRVDARAQLRAAFELFTGMGYETFAERTRRELLATGETVRRRTPDTVDQLTAQEAQIAALAAAGHTNPEIGAQLFLSPRTVEWHLRKVYPKLGVSSRRELRRALPS